MHRIHQLWRINDSGLHRICRHDRIGVAVLDEAVRAAVTLSHRHIPSRQLPDKAISLLDTACACVAMSLYTPPVVVDQLRQRTAALDVEFALPAQEGVISQGSEETRPKRAEAANARLDAAEHEWSTHEAQWQEELAMVRQIQALETRDRGRESAAPGANGPRRNCRRLKKNSCCASKMCRRSFPQSTSRRLRQSRRTGREFPWASW
jgi:type VI secretion system protein VasG